MPIHISQPKVVENLIHFKDSLMESHGKRREKGTRTYKVLFNVHTGEMRFTRRLRQLERHFAMRPKTKSSPTDWQEIRLIAEGGTPSKERLHFEVSDAQGKEVSFKNFEPLAWKVLAETLKVLNQIVNQIKEEKDKLPEESALENLSELRLEVERDEIRRFPGWAGEINRIEAEEMLKGKKEGSYLLREGSEFASSAHFLSQENQTPIHPYLLTFVDKEEKISEILILRTGKGWTLYLDEPDLSQPLYRYYASFKELFHSLKKFKFSI